MVEAGATPLTEVSVPASPRLTWTWASCPVAATSAGTFDRAAPTFRPLTCVVARIGVVVPEQVPVASVQATEHCVAVTVRPSPTTEPLVRALDGAPVTDSVMPAAEARVPVLFRLTYTLSVSPGAILPAKLLKPTPTSGDRVRLRVPELTLSEPVAVPDSPA